MVPVVIGIPYRNGNRRTGTTFFSPCKKMNYKQEGEEENNNVARDRNLILVEEGFLVRLLACERRSN